MNGKGLNAQQTMILVVLFLLGSSLVIGVNINEDLEQDSWVALICSFALIIPLMLIYYRILKTLPEKNIYEIFDILFGKIAGKFLSIIFIIYSIYLGSIVLRNFSEYIEITTLPDTPQLPVMILLVGTTIYLAKSELSTLGRWGYLILIVLLITIFSTIILTMPALNIENIQPFIAHSSKAIAVSSFRVFMLPFAELIVILGIADEFHLKNKGKGVFIGGTIITGIILFVITVRNVLILGAPMIKNSFFNSYEAARILQLGDFLTRVEGIITINLVLAGMTKGTLFMISISKGIAHVTKNKNFTNLIVPTGMILLALCPFLFEDVVDMFSFSPIFGYLAIPMQIILPILVWILAEFYNKKQKKTLSK